MRFGQIPLLGAVLIAAVPWISGQPLALSDAEAESLNTAESYSRAGQFSQAIPLLEAFVHRHEVSPVAVHLLLIRALDGVGRTKDALDAAFRAEAQHPKSCTLSLPIAEMLMRGDQAPLTARHYLEGASCVAEGKLLYAEWALRRRDAALAVEQAKSALLSARAQSARATRAATLLARAYVQQGDTEAAEQAYQEALALNSAQPTLNVESAMEYVGFLEQQGRADEAQHLRAEIRERQAAQQRRNSGIQLNGEPQRLQ